MTVVIKAYQHRRILQVAEICFQAATFSTTTIPGTFLYILVFCYYWGCCKKFNKDVENIVYINYRTWSTIYSSIARDDITYRALPDLDDMLSHPMPTRSLRSVTPPPNFTSRTSNGGKWLIFYRFMCSSKVISENGVNRSYLLFSLIKGLSENAFSSSSTLTSNRYPYNSTMSELFDDLVSQRSRASQNAFENSR